MSAINAKDKLIVKNKLSLTHTVWLIDDFFSPSSWQI